MEHIILIPEITNATLKEVLVQGSPYEIGMQHGQYHKVEIQNFLTDHVCRINSILYSPLTQSEIYSHVRAHLRIIEDDVPHIAMEIEGLAAGADISYEDAALLQLRREIIGYTQIPAVGDCTTIGINRANSKNDYVVAQTVDLNGNISSLGTVIKIRSQTLGKPNIMMFTFCGLLGYVGFNEAGLSIAINLVLAEKWVPGVPAYLLVRHLLNFTDIDSCLGELSRIRRASSRSFIIADKSRMVNVEFTPSQLKVVENTILFHTNHFLNEELASIDQMNIFSKHSSMRRLNRTKELFCAQQNDIDPESIFDIFSDHSLYPAGICVHSEGNIRREETVGAVVMYPYEGCLYVRQGNPCKSQTQMFSF